MASNRQQRGEATRAEILAVARRLFSDFGYHNTGIADIQAATGLTKGAFYHHFRAKQELALGVLEMLQADYAERLVRPAMRESTPGRRLAALLQNAVSLNSRPEWCNCRLLATLSAEVTAADGPLVDAVRSVQGQLLDTLEQILAEAQQAGEIVRFDPAAGAQLILSTLMGLVLARKLGVDRVDTGNVVALLKEALLGPNAAELQANATLEDREATVGVVRLPEDSDYF